jgi:hypothetical protein
MDTAGTRRGDKEKHNLLNKNLREGRLNRREKGEGRREKG